MVDTARRRGDTVPQRALGRLLSAAREPCSHPTWFAYTLEPSSGPDQADSGHQRKEGFNAACDHILHIHRKPP